MKQKRALVCGAGGFIGHHLVNRLKHDGYWVRGIDLKKPEFEPTNADDFIVADLRYLDSCQNAINSGGSVDEVYQLAADTWGSEEKEAIESVIASGQYTIGPRVAKFENAFAQYHDTKHAIMVNSGSSANLIAIASLFYKKDRPLRRGDEIIVPAISWSTTYSPLQQYGLKLRFVDVELETLNIDFNQLKAALIGIANWNTQYGLFKYFVAS